MKCFLSQWLETTDKNEMDTYNDAHKMKYWRVANESEKRLLQEVYTNTAPVENLVIPEVLSKNVDDMVDNSGIMWRDGGQLSPVLIPNEERENVIYKLYKRKSHLTFEPK